MKPRIDVITLAVADLERALAFYRDALGLDSPGVTGTKYVGNETNAAGAEGGGVDGRRWPLGSARCD
jgi:uncharacterized protein